MIIESRTPPPLLVEVSEIVRGLAEVFGDMVRLKEPLLLHETETFGLDLTEIALEL